MKRGYGSVSHAGGNNDPIALVLFPSLSRFNLNPFTRLYWRDKIGVTSAKGLSVSLPLSAATEEEVGWW